MPSLKIKAIIFFFKPMNCYEHKLTDGHSEFGLHIGLVETRESPASRHGFHLTHGHVPVTSFPSNQLLSEFQSSNHQPTFSFHFARKIQGRCSSFVQLTDEFNFGNGRTLMLSVISIMALITYTLRYLYVNYLITDTFPIHLKVMGV